MSYLKEFRSKIANRDYPSFLRLWEEYCASDELDAEEACAILRSVKDADFAESFGKHVERILPLWLIMEKGPGSDAVLSCIVDVQTTNSEQLAQLAYEYLKQKYENTPHFNERIRMVGLRGKESFQGAISRFELLLHMKKGNYVFHTGGWGVGEILDLSLIREQLTVEFDYAPGKKDISFGMAFKMLIPIPSDHFLALRFGNPDGLEKKAKDDPLAVMHMLLKDLGPKTAAEIKDELCELVIPASEWTRWWQSARAKMKKDTMIHSPEDLKEPFSIQANRVTHEERLSKALENKPDAATLIQMVYSFTRDFPETLKNVEFRQLLCGQLSDILSFKELTEGQELQIHFFLADLSEDKEYPAIGQLLQRSPSIESLIESIEIQAFKKRALVEVKKVLPQWKELFAKLFISSEYSLLREYILQELLPADEALFKATLEKLITDPAKYATAFLWYFQKLIASSSLPFSDHAGRALFFESLLILLSALESDVSNRDGVKKIHSILSQGRYAIVRDIFQHTTIKEVEEFLLLASKCHSLSSHDIKILHSLAEVAHPSLSKGKKKHVAEDTEEGVIWTTQEGLYKLQERIQRIATVETVENAKDIEVARAHGDLRENAEFKAALERRDRLQAELKFLSDQLNQTRIIHKEDISTGSVQVGSAVECKNSKNESVCYKLLGPWDADPDNHILSFQSKLAQAMKGLKVGESFQFQGESFTIIGIHSAL